MLLIQNYLDWYDASAHCNLDEMISPGARVMDEVTRAITRGPVTDNNFFFLPRVAMSIAVCSRLSDLFGTVKES